MERVVRVAFASATGSIAIMINWVIGKPGNTPNSKKTLIKIFFVDSMLTLTAIAPLLVDQCPSTRVILKNVRFRKFGILIIWGTWSMFCLAASNMYKGSVFSFLSASSYPKMTNQLNSLLNDNLSLVTMSWFNFNGISHSVLKDIIIPDFLRIKTHSDGYKVLLEDFGKRVKWFQHRPETFPVKILGSPQLLDNGLVMIDLEYSNDKLKLYLEVFTPKWISKPATMDAFVDRRFWTTQSNYFYPIFMRKLAQVYETGIFQSWFKQLDMLDKQNGMYSILNSIYPNPTKKDAWSTVIPFPLVWRYLPFAEDIGQLVKEPPFSGVPKFVYRYIFGYFAVLVLASLTMFIFELVSFKLVGLYVNLKILTEIISNPSHSAN